LNRRLDTISRNRARNRKSRAREYISTATHPGMGRCNLHGRAVRISRDQRGRESQNNRDKRQVEARVAMISAPLTPITKRGPRITELYPFEHTVFIFRSARRRILVPCFSTGLARSAKAKAATSTAVLSPAGRWTVRSPMYGVTRRPTLTAGMSHTCRAVNAAGLDPRSAPRQAAAACEQLWRDKHLQPFVRAANPARTRL
jgi:hypothetical protein